MNEKELIERLAKSAGEVPAQTEIYAVRQYSLDEMTRRLKRMLDVTGKMCGASFDRGDWIRKDQRTLVRLPLGARAVMYHASGAMEVTAGLAPMEQIYGKVEPKEALAETVRAFAERLGIAEWTGSRESLIFERLWQIKAAAADRTHAVEPVLCRIVGAYRQYVGQIPVLGPASVALKLANGGALDSVSVTVRPAEGEPVDWAPTVKPEQAATQIAAQLATLMGRSKTPFTELAQPKGMYFGYLALGKRKPQNVLAPHYVAFIDIEGAEAQGIQLVTAATEKIYLPLCQTGSHPPVTESGRKTSVRQPGLASSLAKTEIPGPSYSQESKSDY